MVGQASYTSDNRRRTHFRSLYSHPYSTMNHHNNGHAYVPNFESQMNGGNGGNGDSPDDNGPSRKRIAVAVSALPIHYVLGWIELTGSKTVRSMP
jgi:hypothetical protein